jgi:hypothetical protein
MRFISKSVSAIFIVVLLSVTLSYTASENTARRVTKEQYYSISLDSILQSIAEGRQDIFVPIDTEPEAFDSSAQEWIIWRQADFLQMAEALYRHIWNEPLDEWRMNFLSFGLPCNGTGKGFWTASFSFFKEIKTVSGISHIERQIDIYPGRKLINVWKFSYEPCLLGSSWNTVESSKTKNSADDALLIAEQSGGTEKRMTVKNACEVSVMLSPNSVNYHGWEVMYSLSIYSLSIDPRTGEKVEWL